MKLSFNFYRLKRKKKKKKRVVSHLVHVYCSHQVSAYRSGYSVFDGEYIWMGGIERCMHGDGGSLRCEEGREQLKNSIYQ